MTTSTNGESDPEWMSAAEARAFLPYGGTTTICVRARVGNVAARARLFIYGENQQRDCAIPPSFWWAEGKDALEQNWDAGDFTTHVPGKDIRIPMRAFGVEFRRSDIENLKPRSATEAGSFTSANAAPGSLEPASSRDKPLVDRI
jgi:hypothetical protein